MRAVLAFVPTVCSFIAFILGMLCLFAGSQKNFLEGADILTLNTSKIGHVNAFDSSVQTTVNGLASDVASDLGIHDFYSVHVMSYCEGYFESSASSSSNGSDAERNVTDCSNRTVLFHFDPSEVLSRELRTGVNLSDLNWSDAIDDDFQVLDVTSKTMAVFYCIGTAATGVAVLTGLWLVLSGGRAQAITELFLTILGFIALGTSSAISTVLALKFVDLINRHGKDIGVSATRGKKFLGMTWAAVGLLLIGVVASLVMVVAGGQSPPPPPPPAEEPAKEPEPAEE